MGRNGRYAALQRDPGPASSSRFSRYASGSFGVWMVSESVGSGSMHVARYPGRRHPEQWRGRQRPPMISFLRDRITDAVRWIRTTLSFGPTTSRTDAACGGFQRENQNSATNALLSTFNPTWIHHQPVQWRSRSYQGSVPDGGAYRAEVRALWQLPLFGMEQHRLHVPGRRRCPSVSITSPLSPTVSPRANDRTVGDWPERDGAFSSSTAPALFTTPASRAAPNRQSHPPGVFWRGGEVWNRDEIFCRRRRSVAVRPPLWEPVVRSRSSSTYAAVNDCRHHCQRPAA